MLTRGAPGATHDTETPSGTTECGNRNSPVRQIVPPSSATESTSPCPRHSLLQFHLHLRRLICNNIRCNSVQNFDTSRSCESRKKDKAEFLKSERS